VTRYPGGEVSTLGMMPGQKSVPPWGFTRPVILLGWRADFQLTRGRGSVAILPLPRPLVAILVNHRRRQIEERLAAGSFWRDTGLVFTTAQGGWIEPRNVGPATPKPH
jgi:hypothetical protein